MLPEDHAKIEEDLNRNVPRSQILNSHKKISSIKAEIALTGATVSNVKRLKIDQKYGKTDTEGLLNILLELEQGGKIIFLVKKHRGGEIKDFPIGKDEFVYAFYFISQKKLLDRFDKKVIFGDGTHSTNKTNLHLYILQIFGYNEASVPILYILSDRENASVYEWVGAVMRKSPDFAELISKVEIFGGDKAPAPYHGFCRGFDKLLSWLWCGYHFNKNSMDNIDSHLNHLIQKSKGHLILEVKSLFNKMKKETGRNAFSK